MVFIVDEGYMTNFETGMISASFWMVYGIMQIFGGMVADRWHPERSDVMGWPGNVTNGGAEGSFVMGWPGNMTNDCREGGMSRKQGDL